MIARKAYAAICAETERIMGLDSRSFRGIIPRIAAWLHGPASARQIRVSTFAELDRRTRELERLRQSQTPKYPLAFHHRRLDLCFRRCSGHLNAFRQRVD